MVRKNTIRTIAQAEAALSPYIPLTKALLGKDLTLGRMKPLTEQLGNPQEKLRVIHVAGTSGKTSTSYFIAALLRATGKRVGLTVSPHVDSITERLQLNGLPLSEEDFCMKLDEFLEIIKGVEPSPSYFELLCAFSLWFFNQAKVDYAVVETGLGGMHDATNIINRSDKVCVITDIGFDHMHVLGYTLPEITSQKVGIVHEGNQLIMYDQGDIVMPVIRAWVESHHAQLLAILESHERAGVEDISSMPAYQQRNWLLAYRALRYVEKRDGLRRLSDEHLKKTRQIQIPGRMDMRKLKDKTLIMDGAHNAQKIAAFIESFKKLFPEVKPAVLLAFKEGKEFEEVAPMFADFASRIIVTSFTSLQDMPISAIDPYKVAGAIKRGGSKEVRVISALDAAYKELLASPAPILVVTGSFYLLGQLRAAEHLR